MGIAKVRLACNIVVILVHANINLDMDDRPLPLLEILVSYVLFRYCKCIHEEFHLTKIMIFLKECCLSLNLICFLFLWTISCLRPASGDHSPLLSPSLVY